jgi:hypothetical protein
LTETSFPDVDKLQILFIHEYQSIGGCTPFKMTGDSPKLSESRFSLIPFGRLYFLCIYSAHPPFHVNFGLRHRNALQAAIKSPITSHPPLHLPCHNLRHPNFSEPNPTPSLIICQHSTDSTYTSDVAFRTIALNNQNFYCAGHGAKNITWSSNHASSSLSWSRQCPAFPP